MYDLRWFYTNGSGTGYWTIGAQTDANEEVGMDVFEYVVVYTGDDDCNGAEIIVGPKTILAADEETVRMIASRAIPEKYAGKLEEIDIYVREWKRK